MNYEQHLLLNKFFFGEEKPELTKEIDMNRESPADFSQFGEHVYHHTPMYALNSVVPNYGVEGVRAHFLHVLGDLSPLQIADFIKWARRQS